MSHSIQTAELDWQTIDGIDIPYSRQFADIYFSKDNGLLESRHVFLNGNDLAERLTQLQSFDYFCVGEIGFGTGLNILALWQMWQQLKPNNNSHLHVISVEKFPLNKDDLIRALNVWSELKPFADQLIAQYPLPLAGCHRLNFPEHRFSIDLWLGDAHDVFPQMIKTTTVNAWFLDGFAPSCNPDLWEENVLKQIVRLSGYGTTFSSFSVAGVVKRGLRDHGITVSRPRGFKHKREMLKAIWQKPENLNTDFIQDHQISVQPKQRHIAIIGAGIAGLSCAWVFAQRGHQVRIYEQTAALAGASGNPMAILNPKLGNIKNIDEHLMTVSWQYALCHYSPFKAFRPLSIHQISLKNHEDAVAIANDYPDDVLHVEPSDLKTDYANVTFHQAGAISPYLLRDEILSHPNITLIQAEIIGIQKQDNTQLKLKAKNIDNISTVDYPLADHVIVCTAHQSGIFFEHYPALKPIRGQVSWFNNTKQSLKMHTTYSYGGYCMQMNDQQMILGASFSPGRDDTDVLESDHLHNYELLHTVFPDYAQTLTPISEWQGRASVRAQTPDYFPLLGKLNSDNEIYTLAGLGSKGFLYSPLCSEVLATMILNEACPIPEKLWKYLTPFRFKKMRQAMRR